MTRVVDASAISAMLFGEPDGDWVHALVSGASLIAPGIFPFELGNTCRMKSRRHPAQAERLLRAWLDWSAEPPVTIMATDHVATIDLSRVHGLTFYDASYLWLAMNRAPDLISLDAQLVRVARTIGIYVPSPRDADQTAPRSRN